jgi:hypothetical protein
MEEIKETFDCWAVLELFGHVRLAGRVTEASIGGCSFLRVDVPDAEGGIQFTRYFGNGAIYSMTPVTEEVARRVGNGSAQAPVKPWEMPKPALPPADDYHEPPEKSYEQDDDDDDDSDADF